MKRAMLQMKRELVCPSCNVTIHFRPEMDDLGTCPMCGESLVRSSRWNPRLERLDYEPPTDFDGYDDWEQSLIGKIG